MLTPLNDSPPPAVLLTPSQVDELATIGGIMVDAALPQPLYNALRQQADSYEDFKPAQLMQGGHQQHIRGDKTFWLDDYNIAEAHYLSYLKALGQQLNSHFYSGVRSVEAHFAHYAPGQCYARHVDNRQGDNVRAFSTVLYLNEQWQATDGGALIWQDLQKQEHTTFPMANRLIIFISDLAHEVKPAVRDRYSIAGWLRRDEGLLYKA